MFRPSNAHTRLLLHQHHTRTQQFERSWTPFMITCVTIIPAHPISVSQLVRYVYHSSHLGFIMLRQADEVLQAFLQNSTTYTYAVQIIWNCNWSFPPPPSLCCLQQHSGAPRSPSLRGASRFSHLCFGLPNIATSPSPDVFFLLLNPLSNPSMCPTLTLTMMTWRQPRYL